jgi:hypothetical protein
LAARVLVPSGWLVSQNNVTQARATPVANFFVAGNGSDRGGVRVAVKDADGDHTADVAAGSGDGPPSRVRVYLGKDFTTAAEPGTFQDLDPFGAALPGGVFVGWRGCHFFPDSVVGRVRRGCLGWGSR